MSTIPRYCSYCQKFIKTEGDKCLDCSLPFPNREQKAFLSGTLGEQRNLVNLPISLILMDRFKIKNHLGNGHMGSIYLAEDMHRSMEIVLKIVGMGPCYGEMGALKLQREMNIHNQISEFKHVIKLFDLHFATWGGSGLLMLSMEYADGGSLRGLLQDLSDNLEIRQTVGLNYFISACHGVAEIHKANVIHLDLKPENLVFVGNILKVSDFGSAICGGYFDSSTDQNNGMWPLEKGTPEYMSPEHFKASRPNELDTRADIYSLGIILFEIFHPECSKPFNGSYSRLRDFHAQAPIPKIDVEDRISVVINRCLEKNPDDRYQSVSELIDDLEDKNSSDKFHNKSMKFGAYKDVEELQEHWEEASLLYSQGKYSESDELLVEILLVQPNHAQAVNLKNKIHTKYEQAEKYYEEIGRNCEQRDLTKSIELLKAAVNLYPDFPLGRIVQVKLLALTERYRRSVEEGSNHLINGSWEAALECYQEAISINPGARHINNIIRPLLKITDARRQIHQALIQKDFSIALRLACLVDLEVGRLKNHTLAMGQENDE